MRRCPGYDPWTMAGECDAAYLAGWRPFFHAVATVAELDAPRLDEFGRQQPLAVELLGQRLVLARLNGQLGALGGTCPHRRAGLHLGWIACAQWSGVFRHPRT